MCLCVCCVYVFVYIYIFNQLSFFPLYKAWELDLISFCHRRKVAQSHIPVCPTFSCVILRVRSCNCVYHPQALSCTALLSALSPTPSSHLFPLKMCLMPITLHGFYFSFSIRPLSFFNICFITFPAVVFLSLFQTFSLSSWIPYAA